MSAAALIIGNEILSGKTQDENAFFLSKALFAKGICLRRIEVVADEMGEISTSLKRLFRTHTYVFTSGGIGPTHDDITYEAIAQTFELSLRYHEPTLSRLSKHYGDRPLNNARKKMALLPYPCEAFYTGSLWVPTVRVQNVYILPGVPALFKETFFGIQHLLQGTAIERVLIYTQKAEGDIAAPLEEIQIAYPEVAIGSYPKYDQPDFRVMISCEGTNPELVKTVAVKVQKITEGFYKNE